MAETVKMFDYWSFHNDGSSQFFQICEGEIVQYQEYCCPEDAPIVHINEQSWSSFVGPIVPMSYHGRSYVAPASEGRKDKD